MSGQPWSVYQTRNRFLVRRWTTNAGLVACFISKEAAREFAARENRELREEREAMEAAGAGRARI